MAHRPVICFCKQSLGKYNHTHLFKFCLWLLFREGNGTPLQYSCLENPMDGGAWWAAVYGVAQGRTRLSDFTFTFHFHALEKEMATHSSVLAWRIPGMGEPGGPPSMGSHKVGHDWSDSAAAAWLLLCYNWRGNWDNDYMVHKPKMELFKKVCGCLN